MCNPRPPLRPMFFHTARKTIILYTRNIVYHKIFPKNSKFFSTGIFVNHLSTHSVLCLFMQSTPKRIQTLFFLRSVEVKVLSQQQRVVLLDTVMPNSLVKVSSKCFENVSLALSSSVKFAQY